MFQTHFKYQRRRVQRLVISVLGLLMISVRPAVAQSTVPTPTDTIACVESDGLAPAVVRVYSGDDTASGVIVSTDGLVLTVAHGIHTDRSPIQVMLSDGAQLEASLVWHNPETDIAVLQLVLPTTPPSLIAITMSPSPAPEKGDPVLALGYPGRSQPQDLPLLRVGSIIASEKAFIHSTCQLTAGDSGGPLVNAVGELIGLHRKIGLGSESNLHIALAEIQRELQSAKITLPGLNTNGKILLSAEWLRPSKAVEATINEATVRIFLADAAESPLVLGTRWNKDFVLTKLSELPSNERLKCVFFDETDSAGRVIVTDTSLDLAVVQLEQPHPPGEIAFASDTVSVGTIVFSRSNKNSIVGGVVARTAAMEPSLPLRVGARMTADAGSVALSEILPNSAAALAGLQAGDRIISISGVSVPTLDEIEKQLSGFQPGDRVLFEIRREQARFSVPLRLQHDVSQRFDRTEFLDGRAGRVSERRSGFVNVIQHDVPLTPEECGGPLCDTNGTIIGINIARRARETTLALPIASIQQLLESKMKVDANSVDGERIPE